MCQSGKRTHSHTSAPSHTHTFKISTQRPIQIHTHAHCYTSRRRRCYRLRYTKRRRLDSAWAPPLPFQMQCNQKRRRNNNKHLLLRPRCIELSPNRRSLGGWSFRKLYQLILPEIKQSLVIPASVSCYLLYSSDEQTQQQVFLCRRFGLFSASCACPRFRLETRCTLWPKCQIKVWHGRQNVALVFPDVKSVAVPEKMPDKMATTRSPLHRLVRIKEGFG